MRRGAEWLVALFAAALLCVAIAACSSEKGEKGEKANSGRSSYYAATPAGARTASSSPTTAGGYLASDEDTDKDDNGDRGYYLKASVHDTFVAVGEGRAASPAERRAITTLVKRYYMAAAEGNGAEACSMLYSPLAAGLAGGQGQPSRGAGERCAAAISRIFQQQHRLLAAEEVATMSVIAARIKGAVATVTVGFRAMPVGNIRVERERGAWKMDGLFDGGLD